MKKTTYILILSAFACWGTLTGCTKFGDINVNPNVPTVASNAQLLTYAINQMPTVIEAPTGMLYAQQWSEKPYTDASRYLVENFDFYDIYSGALENYKPYWIQRSLM